MLDKFLREVVISVVGKQAEEIVELLNTKKYINEFLIAKKLKITINQARNILYKLSDQGLVSSIRKKDKKKGWYTYFWKLEILKCLEFLRGVLSKKVEQTNQHLKSKETKEFYVCERCDREFTEENALLHDFTCSECGGVFNVKDKTKILAILRKELIRLHKEIEFIDEEIKKEKEKLGKEKEKVFKKVEKEKKVAREVQKKLKQKQAKIDNKTKPAKKSPKKKFNKKVSKKKKR